MGHDRGESILRDDANIPVLIVYALFGQIKHFLAQIAALGNNRAERLDRLPADKAIGIGYMLRDQNQDRFTQIGTYREFSAEVRNDGGRPYFFRK